MALGCVVAAECYSGLVSYGHFTSPKQQERTLIKSILPHAKAQCSSSHGASDCLRVSPLGRNAFSGSHATNSDIQLSRLNSVGVHNILVHIHFGAKLRSIFALKPCNWALIVDIPAYLTLELVCANNSLNGV